MTEIFDYVKSGECTIERVVDSEKGQQKDEQVVDNEGVGVNDVEEIVDNEEVVHVDTIRVKEDDDDLEDENDAKTMEKEIDNGGDDIIYGDEAKMTEEEDDESNMKKSDIENGRAPSMFDQHDVNAGKIMIKDDDDDSD